MKKLRIQKMPYINQGTANIRLKGVQEYHAIFKFDTDEEAEDFIKKVNEWYNSLESVKDKVANVLHETTKKTIKSFDGGISSVDAGEALADSLNKFKKDEKTEVVKTTRKKPGPKKGTGGRPKSDI